MQCFSIFLPYNEFFYSVAFSASECQMKPVESQIITKLRATFNPSHLQVLNESYMHAVPANSETHFKVVIAADSFVNKRQVQRHQAIYACLAEQLRSGVHALALHTFSTDEWKASAIVPASPPCLGGSKHDH
jgi:stress-induced morphogen